MCDTFMINLLVLCGAKRCTYDKYYYKVNLVANNEKLSERNDHNYMMDV